MAKKMQAVFILTSQAAAQALSGALDTLGPDLQSRLIQKVCCSLSYILPGGAFTMPTASISRRVYLFDSKRGRLLIFYWTTACVVAR